MDNITKIEGKGKIHDLGIAKVLIRRLTGLTKVGKRMNKVAVKDASFRKQIQETWRQA